MDTETDMSQFADWKAPGDENTRVSDKHLDGQVRNSAEKDPEGTVFQIDEAVIGDVADLIRSERKLMEHSGWIGRISNSVDSVAEIPEGYQFQSKLHHELAALPDEWKQISRREDRPPPPVFDDESRFDLVNIPDHVYAAGVKWEVGNRVGRGAFGSVYEVSHGGGEDQKKRLVKFVAVKGGEGNRELKGGGVGDLNLEMMWNEVGAAMAAGDLLCTEMIQDEGGDTLLAIVMDQYQGEDMFSGRENRMRSGEEMVSSPEWGYRLAVALRSVVATLRKMHSLGWTHRDVKPANVMLPETVDEAMLAHLIDHGIAQGGGVVRTESGGPISGTPQYMLPESFSYNDDDLRLRDYWGAMVTVARTLGLIKFQSGAETHQVPGLLVNGKYLKSPNLFQPNIREEYFRKEEIEGAQREFVQWLYDFIQPQMNIGLRRDVWAKERVTVSRELTYKTMERGRVVEKTTYGDFFDDDKFVHELEDHVRALAKQAGVEMPEGMMESFQEFGQA